MGDSRVVLDGSLVDRRLETPDQEASYTGAPALMIDRRAPTPPDQDHRPRLRAAGPGADPSDDRERRLTVDAELWFG